MFLVLFFRNASAARLMCIVLILVFFPLFYEFNICFLDSFCESLMRFLLAVAIVFLLMLHLQKVI